VLVVTNLNISSYLLSCACCRGANTRSEPRAGHQMTSQESEATPPINGVYSTVANQLQSVLAMKFAYLHHDLLRRRWCVHRSEVLFTFHPSTELLPCTTQLVSTDINLVRCYCSTGCIAETILVVSAATSICPSVSRSEGLWLQTVPTTPAYDAYMLYVLC